MAESLWNTIKISRNTYEKMRILSQETGLSMDGIIKEFLSYPDAEKPSETLYLSSVKEFYEFLEGAREQMVKSGWHKHTPKAQ